MGTEQKVAVITGASRGIGAALVKAYRDRNYRVVATALSIKPSNEADILTVPGDIADRKTAERAISEGKAQFGRIDTLVNNAGIFTASPSPNTPRPTSLPSWGSTPLGSSKVALARRQH
jgi:NAD(P)-dependent dehydrogenase (short-subunit alcohol dehydrogenase family)